MMIWVLGGCRLGIAQSDVAMWLSAEANDLGDGECEDGSW